MKELKTAINLLEAVHFTMDTISVAGINNQDKFVGCANAIKRASQMLEQVVEENRTPEVKEEDDGR